MAWVSGWTCHQHACRSRTLNGTAPAQAPSGDAAPAQRVVPHAVLASCGQDQFFSCTESPQELMLAQDLWQGSRQSSTMQAAASERQHLAGEDAAKATEPLPVREETFRMKSAGTLKAVRLPRSLLRSLQPRLLPQCPCYRRLPDFVPVGPIVRFVCSWVSGAVALGSGFGVLRQFLRVLRSTHALCRRVLCSGKAPVSRQT